MNRLDRFDRLPLALNVAAAMALSASVAYWAMQLYRPQQRPLAAPPPAARAEPQAIAATGLFGGSQAAAVASNYKLTGVVAAGPSSVAIIVVDGARAKSVPLGREVAPGVRVTEVYPRYVMLSEGGVAKRIDLAEQAPPSMAGGGAATSRALAPIQPVAPAALQPLPVVPAQPPAPGVAAVPIPGAIDMAPTAQPPAPAQPGQDLGGLADQARRQQEALGIKAPAQMPPPVMGSGMAPPAQPPVQ